MKQRKIRMCNYAAGTWKYRDDMKKLKESQEDYLYIVKNNITSPEDLQERLAELTSKQIQLAVERKKFNTEGKIYEGIIEKYNRLMELEKRYHFYINNKEEIFKDAYDEYVAVQKEIKGMGLDINRIRDYLFNVKNKKEEYKARNFLLSQEMKIIRRLILKNQNDGLYNIQSMKEEIDENINMSSLEHNFLLWSRTRLENSYEFARALNHHTDNDYARDNYYIVCDRLCPVNYIKIKSTRDVFEGEEYTKSYYEVYKDNELVMKCDDGKFAGRKSTYWKELKKAMQEKSSMRDDNIIFENTDNFEKYLAAYDEHRKKTEDRNKNNIKRGEMNI